MCENRSVAERAWVEVGQRIRVARTQSRLSQDEVAARLGVDRTAVMRMESGARKVSALELSGLAELFDVPLGYFLVAPPPAVVSRRGPAPDEPDAAAREVWRLDVALDAHARDVAWLATAGLLPAPAELDRPRLTDATAARQFARDVRAALGRPAGPLGALADVCAHWGLYVLVVDRDADGASMQIDDVPGIGAAVVSGRPDPGRRRFTAAHELGHHLLRDPYSSDVGVSASRDQRENLINAFAQELLLPEADLRDALAGAADRWEALVRLAAEYRVSWSAAVRAARVHLAIEADLTSRRPVQGDFLSVVGATPEPDLAVGSTSAAWKRAVLAAYQRALITGTRALELLHGAVTSTDDLPSRNPESAPL
jgi:transcriptional regulator with XRE-family HTH domain